MATVIDVSAGAKEGTTLLNVAVAERDGPLVASRAAAGRIVVALTRGTDVAIIAMVSAKGSPGVSTTAFACTLSWNGRTVLAECDPAGGSVLTGYLSSLEIPPIGMLPLAAAALRDQLAEMFAHQLVDLDASIPATVSSYRASTTRSRRAPSARPGTC